MITAVGLLSAPDRNKYVTQKFVRQKFIFCRIDVFYYKRRINLCMSFDRRARDTKLKHEGQENEGVVRNFLLHSVTKVPLIFCLILDTSLKIEETHPSSLLMTAEPN